MAPIRGNSKDKEEPQAFSTRRVEQSLWEVNRPGSIKIDTGYVAMRAATRERLISTMASSWPNRKLSGNSRRD